MKTGNLCRSAALLLALCLAVSLPVGRMRAQAPTGPDTSSSTTEDSTGKVMDVSFSTITVDSRRGPFTYRLGPDLHVIGPKNERLQKEDILPGQTATVYYYLRDGMPTVARVVVLEPPAKAPSHRHQKK